MTGLLVGAGLGLTAVASGEPSGSDDQALVYLGIVGAGAALGLLIGTVVGMVCGADRVDLEQRAFVHRYRRCLEERGYRLAR